MIPDPSCPICEGPMAAQDAHHVAGTWICGACHRDGYVGALEARGVRMHEIQHEWRIGSTMVDQAEVEFAATLAWDLDLRVTFAREGFFSKIFGNRDEIQTGDGPFDKAVLIKTDRPARVARLLESEPLRDAIAELVPRTLEGLNIEDSTCRLQFPLGSRTTGDSTEVKRLLALVFHHLAQGARRLDLPRRPEPAGLPSLDSLHRIHRAGRTPEAVRFFRTHFDTLDPLRSLDSLFRDSRSPRLDLRYCTIASGDFSPLLDITRLEALDLVGTRPADPDRLACLSRHRRLKQLWLDEAPWEADRLEKLRVHFTDASLHFES